jgi:hypothetical protein
MKPGQGYLQGSAVVRAGRRVGQRFLGFLEPFLSGVSGRRTVDRQTIRACSVVLASAALTYFILLIWHGVGSRWLRAGVTAMLFGLAVSVAARPEQWRTFTAGSRVMAWMNRWRA